MGRENRNCVRTECVETSLARTCSKSILCEDRVENEKIPLRCARVVKELKIHTAIFSFVFLQRTHARNMQKPPLMRAPKAETHVGPVSTPDFARAQGLGRRESHVSASNRRPLFKDSKFARTTPKSNRLPNSKKQLKCYPASGKMHTDSCIII